MSTTHSHPRAVYEVQVEGELDRGWEAWFCGLTVALGRTGDLAPVTTITGPVADQAALRGMLCRLWDLNLTLISVRRIEEGSKEEQENG